MESFFVCLYPSLREPFGRLLRLPKGLRLLSNESKMNVLSAAVIPVRIAGSPWLRASRNRCRHRNAVV